MEGKARLTPCEVDPAPGTVVRVCPVLLLMYVSQAEPLLLAVPGAACGWNSQSPVLVPYKRHP